MGQKNCLYNQINNSKWQIPKALKKKINYYSFFFFWCYDLSQIDMFIFIIRLKLFFKFEFGFNFFCRSKIYDIYHFLYLSLVYIYIYIAWNGIRRIEKERRQCRKFRLTYFEISISLILLRNMSRWFSKLSSVSPWWTNHEPIRKPNQS